MTSASIASMPRRHDPFPAAIRAAPRLLAAGSEDVASSSLLLGRLIGEAFEAIDRDRDAVRSSLSRAVALLGAEQARPAQSAAAISGALAPWQARKAAAYIESHLDSTMRVGELAALTRLSRSYFSRAFKATFGRSPRQFMLERRVAQAQRVMLETDRPLCEIALSCGFSDQAHLSRIFRRVIGHSPHAWRRARRIAPRVAAAQHAFAKHNIR